MEIAKVLRYLAASLLIVVGTISLILAVITYLIATAYGTAAIGNLILFGVLYLIIGAGLFADKWLRIFYALGVIVPLIGAILGGIGYATKQETVNLILMIIDIVIVVCCGYLIFKKPSASKSP